MDMQGISGRYFTLYCFVFSFHKILCFPFFIFFSLLTSLCISLELEICVWIRRVGVLEINPFRLLTIYSHWMGNAARISYKPKTNRSFTSVPPLLASYH